MIPIGDFVRRRTTPFVNWTLIAVNIGVFLYTLTLNTVPDRTLGVYLVSEAELFYFEWGGLPACIAESLGVESGASNQDLSVCAEDERPLLQVVSGMFLHAGWFHLLSNMLFLWIFGDNVEDRLGHLRYLLFYLVSGIGAMAAQTFFSLDSIIPTVGASGAIAGVMGAYLLLHPLAMVQVIVIPLFFIPFFLPAVVLIGFWFIMQVLGGLADLGGTTGSNIAWWAHIGGFLAGVVLILLPGMKKRAPPKPPPRYR